MALFISGKKLELAENFVQEFRNWGCQYNGGIQKLSKISNISG